MNTLADDFGTWLHSGRLGAPKASEIVKEGGEHSPHWLALMGAYIAGYQQALGDLRPKFDAAQSRPEGGAMSRLALIASALALTGCTFATPAARNAQLGLTALMAVDAAQTVTIARTPCLFERNPVAAAVFGSKHPSESRVLVTNVVYIAGHWALGSYLDRKANQPVDLSIDADTDMARKAKWRRLQRVYQLATALGHGIAVANNADKKIKPFSNFDCVSKQ